MRKHWSREGIINFILYLEAKGYDLSSSHVQREHGDLHRVAFRYFGNWENAIRAAGLDYEKIRKYKSWTKGKILKEIRKLYEKGEDLSWRNISLGENSSLAHAAIKKYRFGSWENALRAVGIDYSKVRRYKEWNKEKIKAEILRLYREGIPVNSKSVQMVYPALYHASRKRFASWKEAVEYAGLYYDKVALRKGRKPGEILEEIKKIKERGEPLSDTHVRRNYPAIHAGACRAFGCWSKARELIGDFTNYRKKTLAFPGEDFVGEEAAV